MFLTGGMFSCKFVCRCLNNEVDVFLYVESALAPRISNEVWPDGVCAVLMLRPLNACIRLDVWMQPSAPNVDKQTHTSPVASLYTFNSFLCFFLSSAFFGFVFGAFQTDLGNVNVQLFQFVMSFVLKNLCTVFSEMIVFTGFLERMGEWIH